ncbi:MAG: DNRLRE domain-containing protein, partial [Chloroflexi bacterium]|nr:DNRLRE domain-containing protein [Chloroflexota bacterium]
PPISQLLLGESTIDIYNRIGYQAAAFGNHEFDKGQDVLATRIGESTFPWLSANIVVEGTEWDHPAWMQPYTILTVGVAPNQVRLGILGVSTDETPLVTLKGTTDGLVFKDLTDSILHYYDEVLAQSDALIVLAHMGTADSTTYKGLRTVAQELINAGKPVDLMIAGHQHEALGTPTVVGGTAIVGAGHSGRYLGRVDVSVDPATKKLSVVAYTLNTINNTLPADPDIAARVTYWADQVAPIVQQPVGTTDVSLVRDYNRESNMGNLVTTAMLWKADQYDDGEVNGSVDIAFTNAGGLRADINIPAGTTLPYNMTWGDTFNVLPFGNTLFYMDLTGAQVQALLDQSATLFKGILQGAGLTHYWYNDCNCNAPTAWGAYGVMVGGEPLKRDQVYRVVTNDFLAGGQDGFVTFAAGANRWNSYYDMREGLNDYIKWYNANVGPVDIAVEGRIQKLDKVVTILHTNDSHGNWAAGTSGGKKTGFVYLASLIAAERAKNPDALLLDAGDTFQGNSYAYFFKDAADNPIAGGLNLLGYDAFTIGNHEFNFGPTTFATMLGQLEAPILGKANLVDDGSYGFINDNVHDYVNVDVDGVKVSIFGLTNPRVYRYELPTNIPGLTFPSAVDSAAALVPQILTDENPDLLVGLTHVGYAPYGDEVESDRVLAETVAGLDVLIGGHSHTKLDPAVMYVTGAKPDGTLIAQAERYALNLGKVNIGWLNGEMVLREGFLIPANEVPAPDPAMSLYLQPYLAQIDAYNATVIGQTTVPIDALKAYTQETNGANLQADAAVYVLEQEGVEVDVHLSGAMSNRKVADAATPANPLAITKGDMFNLMPYENSLVVLSMNGPQIKAVLERSYRNWYYYNYVPGYGGYSYYTTCMLDTDAGNQIRYADTYPALPNGNNVASLTLGGTAIDFDDADTFYNVSTVNYLAAGSCNFNNAGETIWPLDQIVADTQYYVRDSVIDYVEAVGTVSPAIEGRLQMTPYALQYQFFSDKAMVSPPDVQTFTFRATNVGVQTSPAMAMVNIDLPAGLLAIQLETLAASFGTAWYSPVTHQVFWQGFIEPGQTLELTFAADAMGASKVVATVMDGLLDTPYMLAWHTGAGVALKHGLDNYALGADTWLDLWNPDANFGWNDFMVSRHANVRNLLVQFGGLEQFVPAGARIREATLHLTAFSALRPDPQELHVAPVLTGWDYAAATWNQAVMGMPWSRPGGDFGVAADSVVVNAPGVYAWDVTAIVQDWVDGAMPNFGFGLWSETQPRTTDWRFHTTESADVMGRPELVIVYDIP